MTASEPPKSTRRLPDYPAFSYHHPAFMRPIRMWAVYLALRLIMLLAAPLSLPRLQALGRRLGRIAYRCSARNRELALQQLAMALPELSEAERVRIARACLEHQGMTLLETIALPRLRKQPTPWMRVDGEEHLLAAHRQGKGLILVTGHIGNWELFTMVVDRHRIRTTAVGSPLSNPYLNKIIVGIRRSDMIEPLERGRGNSPRQLLTALKHGHLISMVVDVDIDAQGLWVDFFGVPANTPRAPASLALKLGTPVVQYFDIRQPDGSHLSVVRPVPVTDEIRDAPDPVRAFTEELVRRTEAHIRAYPEQWVWNHRRWKRRPPEPATATTGTTARASGDGSRPAQGPLG